MIIEENGYVVCQKKRLHTEPPKLLGTVTDSYNRYKSEVISADVDFIAEKLTELSAGTNEYKAVNFTIANTPTGSADSDVKSNKYYQVTAKFQDKNEIDFEFSIMQIPYMDNRGIFNIQGDERIFVNESTVAENLQVSNIGDNLAVTFKTLDKQFVFKKKNSNYNMFIGKTDCQNIAIVMCYFAMRYGNKMNYNGQEKDCYKFINDNFSSRVMREAVKDMKNTYNRSCYTIVDKNLKYIDLFSQRLGNARTTIDDYCSFQPALGQYLAEDVLNFKAGDLITQEIMDTLYLKCCPCIKIKSPVRLKDLYIAEGIHISKLNRGMKVTEYLKRICPGLFDGMGYIDKDTTIDITIPAKIKITDEIEYFLNSLNLDYFTVSSSKTGVIFQLPCKLEIRNNGTIPARLFYGIRKKELPPGMSADTFVGLSGKVKKKLDYVDIIAIITFICNCIERPDLFNTDRRDIDYTKIVNTFAENFSLYYRKAVDSILRSYDNRKKIQDALYTGIMADMDYIFNNKVMTATYSNLYGDTITRSISARNPCSLISNIRRINTILKDANQATYDMRSVLMGHYGRICPFDTPQSKQIGLVNSQAIRSKIIDKVLYTPYHRIIHKNGKFFVNKEIEYLSPKDEFSLKIGDILTLELEDKNASVYDTPIKNTIVMARVPSIDYVDSERITIESVPSHSLDYVNVYEDQILSVCNSLIPFIGADDGVRVSFGGNMFKQATAVIASDMPYVYTDMYKWVIDDTGYVTYAQDDGEIINITQDFITVKYDTLGTVNIPIGRLAIRSDNVSVMEVHVSIGEHISKGQLLIDSIASKGGYWSAGVNSLVAYIAYYGYNHEDGIIISEAEAEKYTSLTPNIESIELRNASYHNYYITEQKPLGTYISANTIICKIASSESPDKVEVLRTGKTISGVLHSINKIVNENDDTETIVAKIISFDELHHGDKLTGRHGNKGVVTLIEKNSLMPSFLNGERPGIILNPNGIGSRMNIGQLLEANLQFVGYLLDLRIKSNGFNGASDYEIKTLMQYVYNIANTETGIESVISNYSQLPSIIHEHARSRFEFIQKWKNCFYPDGTATLINNRTGKPFENCISIGCSYILKLEHEVLHKVSSRGGLTEDYRYKQSTKQPTHGAAELGGQNVGEMELWAFAAHGATHFIEESLNDCSDNVKAREWLENGLEGPFDYSETSPYSFERLNMLMESFGVYASKDFGSDLSLSNIIRCAKEVEAEEQFIPEQYNTIDSSESLSDILLEDYSLFDNSDALNNDDSDEED